MFEIYNAPEEIKEAIKASILCNSAESGVERKDGNGWWADCLSDFPLGSRLWKLEREVLSPDTLKRAEIYANSALKWLVDKKILKAVHTEAQSKNDKLFLVIRCVRD